MHAKRQPIGIATSSTAVDVSAAPRAADQDWWVLMDDLSITSDQLRLLIEQFESDFSAKDGGYRQFAAITNDVQRAVVSDQLLMTATAIRSNIIEARLHQRQLEGIFGSDGLRFPEEDNYADWLRQSAEIDMAVTGCVRAMGSALDCLAGVAVGVTRMPFSLTKAAYSDIARLDERPKVFEAAPRDQQRAWRGVITICQRHEQLPPEGWLDWLLNMRNLNVHRARQTHTLLQRTRASDQPQLLVATAEPHEIHKSMARFDMHLRRRPNLPDMQDFITTPKTSNLWVNETASTTIAGVYGSLNALIEEAAEWLASCWRHARKWPSYYPVPTQTWALGEVASGFLGVAPSAQLFPIGTSHVGEVQAVRLALAEKLRR